jgi:hypothetical protein
MEARYMHRKYVDMLDIWLDFLALHVTALPSPT